MPQLDTLCSIYTGASFRGRIIDEPAGTCRVVQLRDVDWEIGRIAWEDLARVSDIEPRPHHILNAGDVLFAAKGQANRALLVSEDGRAVATSTFFVIRPKTSDVLAAYVGWYINTAPAQGHFRACGKGTNLRSISKSCLGSLDLPIPPLDVQRRIVETVRLAAEERRLLTELSTQKALLVEQACLSSLT